MAGHSRVALVLFTTAVAATVTERAGAFISASVGGHPREWDTNVHFIGEFGKIEPTERPSTFQRASIKILTGGVGYSFGTLGPLRDFYLRLEGGYFTSGAESVGQPDDDLRVGHRFFEADRGGWVTATVAANFVHEPRFAFGAFLQGTVPIGGNVEKFSNPHMSYAGGGTTLGVFITDPTKFVRLAYASRIFFGSGVYRGGAQQNAVVAVTNLLALELSRWALPWKMGAAAARANVLDRRTAPASNPAPSKNSTRMVPLVLAPQ